MAGFGELEEASLKGSKKMIHSDIFSTPHTNTCSGVSIASGMNHQHFNSEAEGASVALNKIALVHVFGESW